MGFMGVGKSTVGRLAATALGRPFLDLDDLIVERSGTSIPDLFAQRGEPAFRELETASLCEAQTLSDSVLSVGGGVPCRAANVPLLRAMGCLALLTALPITILSRVQPVESRPMLAGAADPLQRIEELLSARRTYYEIADFAIATDGRTPDECAADVVDRFRAWLGANE